MPVLYPRTYQGSIFFSPFFLLLDSFGFVGVVACVPSVLLASLVAVEPSAAGAAVVVDVDPSAAAEPAAGGGLVDSGAVVPVVPASGAGVAESGVVVVFTSSEVAPPVALPAGAA